MYRDLLGLSLGEREGPATDVSTLAAEARESRVRLLQPGEREQAAADRVALELHYDRLLIRLASTIGLPTRLEEFDVPRRARQRLELALEAQGVALVGGGAES